MQLNGIREMSMSKPNKNSLLLLIMLSFTCAISAQAQTAPELVAKGTAAFNAYQLSKAERHYLLALRQDDTSMDAYSGLIRLYQAQKRYTKGLEMAEKAIKLNSSDPALWVSKGLLLRDSGDINKANQSFMRAVDRAANNEQILRQAEDHFYSVGNQILAREIGIQRKQLAAGAK